jgi:hypothetical protein
MADKSDNDGAADAMRLINRAWLDGRVHDIAPAVHPEIVMVFPGFSGRARGREALIAGFRDFIVNAKIHEFHEHDHQTDIVGDTAVISFAYEMRYERSAAQYRVTGRDLWVFQRHGPGWVAIWRAMLDVNESPA